MLVMEFSPMQMIDHWTTTSILVKVYLIENIIYHFIMTTNKIQITKSLQRWHTQCWVIIIIYYMIIISPVVKEEWKEKDWQQGFSYLIL